MTDKNHRSDKRFAICVRTDDADLLTPRMIYQILPDESAANSNYVRVVDNEGEDYLYPARYFVFVDFPASAKLALSRAKVPTMRSIPAQRSRSVVTARKHL